MKSYLSKRNRKRQSRKTSKRHKKIKGGGEKPLDVDYTIEESARNKINDKNNLLAVGRIFRKRDERLQSIKRINPRELADIGSQSEINYLFALGKKYINLMVQEEMKREKRGKTDQPLKETSPDTFYFQRHSGVGSDTFIERIKNNLVTVSSRPIPRVIHHTDRSDAPTTDDVVRSYI